MIELNRVRNVLAEVQELVETLDGVDLDETDALTSQSKSKSRAEKAARSQELQLLANRLELAASLVRVEYWHARGESDPLAPSIGRGGDD